MILRLLIRKQTLPVVQEIPENWWYFCTEYAEKCIICIIIKSII